MCCSSVSASVLLVCIAMSSMYTVSHCSTISSEKIEFIIVWNVTGELVSPKNMTVGSNKPLLVMKATFHSSPSLIQMLLYPQRMSNLVYSEQPFNRSISSGMRGSG
jgi:hypothetical protein